jgi:hypothetical protein
VADPPCKYFDACGLSGDVRVGGDCYCILHLSPAGPPKDELKFNAALTVHVNGGRSDFRWMYFTGQNPSFKGHRFAGVVDFRDATVLGMLDLTESVCDRDALLGRFRANPSWAFAWTLKKSGSCLSPRRLPARSRAQCSSTSHKRSRTRG